MAQRSKYPKVPAAKISSIDISSFDAGLDQRGEANTKPNSFTIGRNVMVDNQGLATYRLGLKKWGPDTVGTVYEVFPALYNGEVLFITADDGKIRYFRSGDTSWTDASGTYTVTTHPTVVTFLRVLDKVLILNGVDKLGYFDLATKEVIHFDLVADPTTKPTGALTGLTGTTQKLYYTIWHNGTVGTTASAPILIQPLGKIREQWKSDGTEGVTIADPNPRGANVKSWNVGLSTAPQGGTIQFSDILPIALGLDINTTTFFDNGTIQQLTNSGTAPAVNSTEGPKAKYGVEIEGRPFLFGITDDEYTVLIGGDNEHAMDFTTTSGGYRLVLNSGTNYFPMSVVGFRNGQGIPSITVLFSNTQGLSKQSIIEQNTISLGTFSATVWGSTEQNYGAAGVSSPYATVNYKGMLVFPTVDGILQLNTQASLQNVLLPERISDPVIDEVGSIKTELLNQIVGTAWANRIMMTVPARGFDYNNKILIYDTTRKNGECWYTFDIRCQWLGTVSPQGSAGFVYVCQDNHLYRLDTAYVAQDELSTGLTQPFSMELTTSLIGTNTAHDGFFAAVQVVFYLADFLGEATLTVTWRDYQSDKMKNKTMKVHNGSFAKTSSGGWSSSGYLFNQVLGTSVLRWGDVDLLDNSNSSQKSSRRFRMPLNNVVTNEMRATVSIGPDNSAAVVRSISFQGQPLGISPDVR